MSEAETAATASPAPAGIEVRIELDRRINFAMQQNDVPVVKSLQIVNHSTQQIRDVRLRITAEPAFAREWSTDIASIDPDATYNVRGVSLQLSPKFLEDLTERLRGEFRIKVSAGGHVVQQSAEAVELLARDEWSGLSSLPEILAAFVLPNHPGIAGVLRSAADLLETWTGNPALDGYQSKNPKRVYLVASAIYEALRQSGITYVNPPASFEEVGQRVRLADRILETKMATCLDMGLLAAACLEAAGLHPLVVLVSGHAFAGVWLNESCFGESVIPEALTVRKRLELGEISVFDPTCATARPAPEYEHAEAEAKRRFLVPTEFCCAIDIKRARKGLIRPLPERSAQARAEGGDSAVISQPGPAAAPVVPQDVGAPTERAIKPVESAATRIDRWCRRLLDFSLRNRLLNFKPTKKTLRILCPDVPTLEDMLASGTTFAIRPRPEELGSFDPRDAAAHRSRTGQEGLDTILREEMSSYRLRADATSEEMGRRLVDIYRAARLALEEGGASALFLAVGSLAWYESPTSSERRIAPILLIPLELHRKSMLEGFTLRQADDEPRINVTLLEFLKKDHGITIAGLDPLPEGESGLDVPLILRTVRQAVRDIDRWEVIDDLQIGLFSFTKFLMWRDLSERTDELVKNAVVNHLVNTPNESFDAGGSFPDAERLDEYRAPKDVFCPLPADSSQLRAVFAAAEGRSFVIEGPPGTGKSQTITNLIAHCLSEGRTILFVSEKMAALNVVKKRLEAVGLGRYCLELHSNKAHKREVVAQLDRALSESPTDDHAEWIRTATRIGSLRADLNAYANALHQKRPSGETVFQGLSRLIGLKDVPRVDLRWDSPDAIDADRLADIRDAVAQIATVGQVCGDMQAHPWKAVSVEDWNNAWEAEVVAAIDALADRLEATAIAGRECAQRLGLAEAGWSLDDLDLLRELALLLMDSPTPPAALLTHPDWTEVEAQIGFWIEHGRTRDKVREKVREGFRDEIIQLDLDDLWSRLSRSSVSWWPASWWRRRPIRKALRGVAVDSRAPAKDQLTEILARARKFREEQQLLDQAADDARNLLGRFWNDGEAEWERVGSLRDWAGKLRGIAMRAAGSDIERAAELRERWARLATEGRDLLRAEGEIGRVFIAFGEARDRFEEARRRVIDLLKLDAEAIWGDSASADALGRVRSSVEGWRAAPSQLRDWCAWRRARGSAMRAQLGPLVEAFEAGRFPSSALGDVFDRSYSQWWTAALTDAQEALNRFSSPEHERKIHQFQELDDRYMDLARIAIRARLDKNIPAIPTSARQDPEMGVLKREIGKKTRHKPVRQLLAQIPNLLPRLKPCLLMSPMSVAQYLSPSYPPFDVVVFDEASQIPVWDAIGAIARGKQAIIVGDPRQLPPTTFFQRAADDEEAPADDVVEDLESILDDCMSARIPWLPLNWHYRSRHESLITFSNYHYYANRLLSFPSAHIDGLGVSWRHVPNGVYDKGKSRTNLAEAEAITAEIVRRLRDPELSAWSIGVVTFNEAQQTLIENLLDAERVKDPSLEEWFAEGAEEAVFVKNLENVQGDERDVILFSICYGPDAQGRVAMNFGPMNRDGGERRLNVAITRARREVVVFSTLVADQIDLSRTRARGVSDLKRFLAYAQHGPSAIAEAIQLDPDADFDSPFEEAVHEALVQRGWHIHKQVGCSSYRIDLAIVDPAAPGRYLLGVECDGANYHRAKTARDRDKLREGILRDLGWKLHRIWSTDWWVNPEREIEKLEAVLAGLRPPSNLAGES